MTAQAQQATDKAVTDRIETRVEVNAPRSRVWRAVSTAREFETWFGIQLDGEFTAGATVRVADSQNGRVQTFEILGGTP